MKVTITRFQARELIDALRECLREARPEVEAPIEIEITSEGIGISVYSARTEIRR